MKLHMQVFIALGLGIKRNWHIFLGLILGIILGIVLNAKKGYFECVAAKIPVHSGR